ncbi:MAG: hypothetical protein ACI8TX_000918 [Hyphomicrobiaceae bacterium]|jgi:hypothetical protein
MGAESSNPSTLYDTNDGEEPLSILKDPDASGAAPEAGPVVARDEPRVSFSEESPAVFSYRSSADRNASRVSGEFAPRRPDSLEDAGLTSEDIERLVTKLLYTRGAMSGRRMAERLGLPFRLLEPELGRFKSQILVAYRQTAAMGDYEYIPTDLGSERARRYLKVSTYADVAPVPLNDYIESVAAQSLTKQRITATELRAAFEELVLDKSMLDRLGPAINSGRGMFLYGSPGNGKTSIAERITRCFGTSIWVPKAISVEGEIIRLFDPVLHDLVEDSPNDLVPGESEEDARWVRIARPTVVIGGELTMDQLEMRHNPETNVSEAPLQMKSNCGCFVIDDFGRQRMPTTDLLNRWIVPLEKRYDFQSLASGKKIEVPFDQLIVFSTNLEPRDLVDEAFLRRIPYKIEVGDPTEQHFREIFALVAPGLGFKPNPEVLEYLIETHFRKAERNFRSCHPRDLLLQAKSWCHYNEKPLELAAETMDSAVENYFAVM